jgi:Zn-dependent protease
MGNIDFAQVGIRFVPFLFALCFHEYAHGWVARLKGDRTAEQMGRLTMNPAVHIDVIGTLVLPLAAILFGFPFFGWAKPVPVDSRNFKNPVNDMFWVSIAGPLSNILLAAVGGLILYPIMMLTTHGEGVGKPLNEMLQIFVLINLFLAFFNLIPLHPLDGGKVIARFLPYEANRWLEENQSTLSWILMIVFLLGGFRFLVPPVYFVAELFLQMGARIAYFIH